MKETKGQYTGRLNSRKSIDLSLHHTFVKTVDTYMKECYT